MDPLLFFIGIRSDDERIPMQTPEENTWIQTHVPCPYCGSSDAFCIGTKWSRCFSCNQTERMDPDTQDTSTPLKDPVGGNLITGLDFSEIKARFLTEETCRKWQYGTAVFGGQRVQVAQYYRDGRVVAQKVRDRDKKFCILGDSKKLPLFGQHLWAPGGKTLVITEGEIDAMSVSQVQDHRWPVVSVPTGAPSAAKSVQQALEFVESFDRVVVMMDNDDPGREAAQAIAELLSPGKACIATLPLKDANDCLKAGKADEIRRAFWNATPWRPDAILAGAELLQRVRAFREPVGLPWPWDGMVGMSPKMEYPSVVTVIAGTGVGKSTFCRALEHHIIKSDENLGVIHLEEDVVRSALGVVGYELGKRIDRSTAGVDPEELERAFHATAGREGVYFYDAFGSTAVDNILAKVRYLAKAGKCKYIILDHLSIVISGLEVADERKAIDLACTKLRTLVQELGVCLILVCHLKRTDGKPAEEGGEVSLQDIRGSQAIAQLSDLVLALERDQQAEGIERNMIRLRILKNRPTGETGVAIGLLYDRLTGRLVEVSPDFGAIAAEDEFDAVEPERAEVAPDF